MTRSEALQSVRNTFQSLGATNDVLSEVAALERHLMLQADKFNMWSYPVSDSPEADFRVVRSTRVGNDFVAHFGLNGPFGVQVVSKVTIEETAV